MKSPVHILTLSFAIALAFPCVANADPIGKVIFQSGSAFIVGPNGAQRPANKGDLIQPGERLVTGANTLAQVKMQDGSFVGIRPGSDLKFQDLRLNGPDAGQTVALNAGSVRVLNIGTNGATKPVPLTVQAGDARIIMRGADIESALKRGGTAGPETITRLNHGEGTLSNGVRTLNLALNEVSAVTKAGIVDVPTTALPPIDVKPSAAGEAAIRTAGLSSLGGGLPQKGELGGLSQPRFDTMLDPRGTGGLAVSTDLKQATNAIFVPSSTLTPGSGSLLLKSPALPTTILSNPNYTGGANEIAAAIVGNGSVGIIKTEQITLPPSFVPPPPPPGTVPSTTVINTVNTSLTGLGTFTPKTVLGTGTIILRR